MTRQYSGLMSGYAEMKCKKLQKLYTFLVTDTNSAALYKYTIKISLTSTGAYQVAKTFSCLTNKKYLRRQNSCDYT